MSEFMDQEVIDFILKDKKHIGIAALIYRVFEDVRKIAIKEFTTILHKALAQILPQQDGWEINSSWLMDDPLGNYTGLGVRQKHWPSKMFVGIEAGGTGARNWKYGVWGEEGCEFFSGLKAYLDKGVCNGSAHPTWAWYRYAEQKWLCWDTPESLASMRDGETGEICAYFCNRIATLAKHVADFMPAP
jgi:hypothetical protein